MDAFLRNIADNTAQGRNDRAEGGIGHFKSFMDTKPPVFTTAEDPLQVDEWLHAIEDRFRVCRCTKEQKAEYNAFQLQGPAGLWWSHQRNAP